MMDSTQIRQTAWRRREGTDSRARERMAPEADGRLTIEPRFGEEVLSGQSARTRPERVGPIGSAVQVQAIALRETACGWPDRSSPATDGPGPMPPSSEAAACASELRRGHC